MTEDNRNAYTSSNDFIEDCKACIRLADHIIGVSKYLDEKHNKPLSTERIHQLKSIKRLCEEYIRQEEG